MRITTLSLPLRFLYLLSSLYLWPLIAQAQQNLLLQLYSQEVDISLPPSEGDAAGLVEADNPDLSSLSSYQESIELTQLQQGPYSFELAEELQALGELYQGLSQHSEAIAQFEAAQAILRINNGLFSLDQENLLNNMMQSYIALGNSQQAARLQEYRYFLYQKNYSREDPQFIEASLDMVDWYLQNYQRDPEDLSAFTSDSSRSPPSLNNNIALFDRSLRRFYFIPRANVNGFDIAIACINDSFSYMNSNPTMDMEISPNFVRAHEILEFIGPENNSRLNPQMRQRLLMAQVDLAYQAKSQLEFLTRQVSRNPFSPFNCSTGLFQSLRGQEYGRGRAALEANIALLKADPINTPEVIASAELQLADFHLAFGYDERAHPLYLQVYQQLQTNEVDESSIDRILNQANPLFIPDFSEQPYSAAAWGYSLSQDIPYEGYIDVQVTRNPRGEITTITLQSSSKTPTDETVNKLVRLLSFSSSRPSLYRGIPLEDETLNLRYYYSEQIDQD
jgi:hypothetical protein